MNIEEEDPDIVVGRLIREALGIKTEPGRCRDCGGNGVVPDGVATQNARESGIGLALFKECPTCGGQCFGGVA